MTDWIEANGVSLRYDLQRHGERPVLVLLHEIAGSIESWDACMPVLLQHFDVLRYDQRGFGLSEKTRTLHIDQMVADLAALLEALDLRTPCLLSGAAMGAGIAIAFALAHPDRVRALAVASPALGYPPGSPLQLLEARAELLEREGMRATTDLGFERTYPEPLRGPGFARYRLRWLGNDPLAVAAISRVASRMHLEPALPRIRCPTLVMGCTRDLIRPAAQSAAIAAQIPGSRYVEIDAAHFSAVQAPDAYAAAVAAFLRGICGPEAVA